MKGNVQKENLSFTLHIKFDETFSIKSVFIKQKSWSLDNFLNQFFHLKSFSINVLD